MATTRNLAPAKKHHFVSRDFWAPTFALLALSEKCFAPRFYAKLLQAKAAKHLSFKASTFLRQLAFTSKSVPNSGIPLTVKKTTMRLLREVVFMVTTKFSSHWFAPFRQRTAAILWPKKN